MFNELKRIGLKRIGKLAWHFALFLFAISAIMTGFTVHNFGALLIGVIIIVIEYFAVYRPLQQKKYEMQQQDKNLNQPDQNQDKTSE